MSHPQPPFALATGVFFVGTAPRYQGAREQKRLQPTWRRCGVGGFFKGSKMEYTVYVKTRNDGFGPEWAEIEISEDFLFSIQCLRDVCVAHNLLRATQAHRAQDWGGDDGFRPQGDELHVCDSGNFYFQAHGKYCGNAVETALVAIEDVRAMLDYAKEHKSSSGDLVFAPGARFAYHEGCFFFVGDEDADSALEAFEGVLIGLRARNKYKWD